MKYLPDKDSMSFGAATWYRTMISASTGAVHEQGRRRSPFPYSERHLQCIWADPRFRPQPLTTRQGETVTVLDPGIWNLEAGPDFLGADLLLGPGQRRLRGDVEIHVRPRDWTRHGHGSDPRYAGVRVHVTYFGGCSPETDVPAGAVHIALKEPLDANPAFSFDAIDIHHYPYGERAETPPCSEELAAWPAPPRHALLEAAGEERLRRKAERMRARAEDVGEAQAVYEEVMAALGYTHNKQPMRQLAERLPVDELRRASAGCADKAYALLAGTAGLLPAELKQGWDEETRAFVRRTWDSWWKANARTEGRCLEADLWRRAGLRPANQPLRRLMAAAALFTGERTPDRQWLELLRTRATGLGAGIEAQLSRLSHPYWSHRWSLGGRRLASPAALVGTGRVRSILINVAAPLLATVDGPAACEVVRRLPADDENNTVRRAAYWLFGPDHPRALYRSGLRQQGLIQIVHDFCLLDRSRCRSCPLPSLLRAHRETVNIALPREHAGPDVLPGESPESSPS